LLAENPDPAVVKTLNFGAATLIVGECLMGAAEENRLPNKMEAFDPYWKLYWQSSVSADVQNAIRELAKSIDERRGAFPEDLVTARIAEIVEEFGKTYKQIMMDHKLSKESSVLRLPEPKNKSRLRRHGVFGG